MKGVAVGAVKAAVRVQSLCLQRVHVYLECMAVLCVAPDAFQ